MSKIFQGRLRAVQWALVSMLLASPALARLEVRMVLPDGSPAAGYSVSVVGSPVAARTAEDGRLVLDPSPAVPFVLVAVAPGGEVALPIPVAEQPAAGAEFLVQAAAADSVTVVSGIAPGIEQLPANAATVMTADALEQRPVPRLALALESIAGAGKLDGGADGVPALRGLARGRTLVLIDGLRVTAERRAGPSATFLDPAALASLEVVRGPGSVVYGSDAFGGVINAVSRDPEGEAPTLRYALESFSLGLRQQSAYAALSGPVLGGSALLDLYGATADNWDAGGGSEVYNSAFESRGGSLRYLRPTLGGSLRVGVRVDRGHDIDKPAIDSRANTASYPTEASDRLQASWIGRGPGKWDSLETSALLGRYRLVLDRERVATPSVARRIDRSDVESTDYQLRSQAGTPFAGGRLEIGFDLFGRDGLRALFDRTTYGADGQSVTGFARTVAIDDAHQHSAGLFATWTRRLGKRFALAVGGRGDGVWTRNWGGFFGDRSQRATEPSGNLALTVHLAEGWSLVGQVARGFRVPTLSDRYFVGPSGRGSVFGNPDLEPEKSMQTDLALRYSGSASRLGLFAYRYRISDLVERYSAGSDFRFRNRGSAVLSGIEAEGQHRFGERWSGDFGAAWAKGEADGRDPLADVAAPNGWLGLRWTGAKLYLQGRVTGVLDKDAPGPAEKARPGYTLVDLGGGFRWNEAIELRLLVRNVGDKNYIAAADELSAPSPGRTVQLGISGRF